MKLLLQRLRQKVLKVCAINCSKCCSEVVAPCHEIEESASHTPPQLTYPEVPLARVGHSSTSIGSTIYIHGGRGGPSMSALPEDSRIWAFSTITQTWTALDAPPNTPRPETRSYHAMASTPFPGPPKAEAKVNVANVLTGDTPNPATDLKEMKENSYGTIFLSSGCLSSGGRTSDLWSFDLASLTWAEMPSASEPGRGGTSLTVVKDKLYRFGGFDGKTELGGQIDVLELNIADEFNDQGGEGIMAVSPRGQWRKILISPEADRDGKGGNKLGPTNRSVAGLVYVKTVSGRQYLVIIAGEGKASDQGHAGAGKFLDDVWTFEVKPEPETVAGVMEQAREAAGGRLIEEGTCTEVVYILAGETGDKVELKAEESKPMGRRGWFAACEAGAGKVLVWGGVGEDNERLGDGWLISVE
jgi:hypothetical protein